MSTRRKRLALALALFAGLLGPLGLLSLPLARYADADDKADAGPKKADPAPRDTRKADRAAIQAQLDGFLKAFEAGDAGRVASFWTAGGEPIGDDSSVYRACRARAGKSACPTSPVAGT
jgi:hypothetical protein